MTSTDEPRSTSAASDLTSLPYAELRALAQSTDLAAAPELEHDELCAQVALHQMASGRRLAIDGVMTLLPEGYGFLRQPAWNLEPCAMDVFVSPSQVRSLHLREGHRVRGLVRPPRSGERFLALQHVESVQGRSATASEATVPFASRTPTLPLRPLLLHRDPHHRDPDTRDDGVAIAALAALAPFCHGHRVMLCAPASWPRARLLAQIAAAAARAPMPPRRLLCLIDQRPEDVAAARQLLHGSDAEVFATPFAAPPERHVALAELSLATAQRHVERGEDVLLLFDSLTALVRAASRLGGPSGAWAAPGLDAAALLRGKVLFASARQCAEGGSLTIVAGAADSEQPGFDHAVSSELLTTTNANLVVTTEQLAAGLPLPFDVVRTITRPEHDPRAAAVRAAWLARRRRWSTLPALEQQTELLALLQDPLREPR